MNYESVISKIPTPNYKEKVVKDYQSTNDIIKDLVYCFKNYNYQAKPIIKLVRTGNVKQDGKIIWDFIRKNIEYKAEPEGDQTTRSFSRILHDKWGDCKHSALIVGSIGWNEGYSVIFRFVSYTKGETFGHVYTILEDKRTGERVIVDPLQKFNYEKDFKKKNDYKANNDMTLSRLTGVPDTANFARSANAMQRNHLHKRRAGHCPAHLSPHTASHLITGMGDDYMHGMDNEIRVMAGGHEIYMTPNFDSGMNGAIEEITGIGRRSKAQRKATRAARKQKRKERGGAFKMIALAPVRGAFSALLLLNFKGFASKFKKLVDNGKENEVKAFAKKFGYKYSIFHSQVNRGASKKQLGEINGDVVHNVDGMGIIVTATAIATASVAIAAAVSLFKRLGISTPGDAEAAANAAADIASGKVPDLNLTNNSGGGGSVSPGGGGQQESNTSPGGGGGSDSGGGSSSPEGGENNSGSEEEKKAKGFLGLSTPVLVIGGIGLAVVAGKVFKLF